MIYKVDFCNFKKIIKIGKKEFLINGYYYGGD